MNQKIMESMGFKKEVEEVNKGNCPFCRTLIKISDFKDELSRKEYFISGLCQECQDKMFGG